MKQNRSLSRLLRGLLLELRDAHQDGRPLKPNEFLDQFPQLRPMLQAFLSETQSSAHADQDGRGSIAAEYELQDDRSPRDLPTLIPQPIRTPGWLSSASSSSHVFSDLERHSDGSLPDYECKRFGDYEVLQEIARGGMGVVYKARQCKLGRTVALKMILAGELAGPEDVRRFRAEAKTAAQLDHPHIVPIYEVGEHEGQHFYSMGYVDGADLSDLVRREALSPKRIATLIQQIAQAVDYAHIHGVIHRDLKPSNVLIDQEYKPRITDFGIAKLMEEQSDLTQTGQVLGTPGYMAPEQAAGKIGLVGRAADIYAIGGLLYFCLTRRPPFQAASSLETLVQVLENEPALPSTVNKATPKPLERICMRCLEREPNDRYASANEVALELERYLQGQPVLAEAPSILNRIRKFGRRSPAFAAHLLAIGFALMLSQVRYWTSTQVDINLHFRVVGLLGGWLGLSVCMHWLPRIVRAEMLIDTVWLCADAVLLGGLLYLLATPEFDPGVPLVGYPLLIVASGLFFRTRLVFLVTIASIVSFIGLQIATHRADRFVHHQFLFVVVLALIGGCLMHQIRRVRALSQYLEVKE